MPDLRGLGARLRAAGLTPRALAAWAGTDRLAALPARLPALAAREPGPASAALALFVAGAELALDRVRLPVDELVAAGLVERAGHRLRAPRAILPLGPSLLVCDHADAPEHRDLVCWPDDSSHHLASALDGGRRDRWLDLGCGSAFAPLVRPGLATRIVGIDINARAVAHARLGAALSGIGHLAIEEADLGADRAPAALVTCNAPILDGPARVTTEAVWRRADPSLVERLWPTVRACAAPGGEIIVHATLAAIPAELPGEQAIVVYTPPGTRAFAVMWWRPDGPARRVIGARALTPARPHVDAGDRAAALAGELAPAHAR